MIGAAVELNPGVWKSAALEADFRADPPQQSEPLGRIEQIVARVIAEAAGDRGDEKSPPARLAGRLGRVPLVGRQQLGAEAPRPLLLPDEIALPLETRGKRYRLGFERIAVDMAGEHLRVEYLVAPQPIAAAERNRAELLLRTSDPAHRQRAFGIEEIAVLPAGLGANSFARAIAELAGNGSHRRGFELHRKINRPAFVARDLGYLDRGDQAGGNQCPAEVGDLVRFEPVARLEPGD